jgi:phosphoadenosine phosphosulfate reductase
MTPDHVSVAIARLVDNCPPDGYYLAFSGGKDSTVVHELARIAGVRFDAHHSLTSVEPPELVMHVRRHYPDVEVHRPSATMWSMIESHRYPPTRRIRYCCEMLKEREGRGRVVLTGVRWEESPRRAKRRVIEACTATPGKMFVHPIIDWTAAQVWEFIRAHDLPYCSLYDEGFARVGCVMCPLASDASRARDAIRWPKIADAYRRACARAALQNVERGKDALHLIDGDAMYARWLKPPILTPPGSGRGSRVCEVCGGTYAYTWTGQRTCGRPCGLELKRRNAAAAQAALFDGTLL